ncbi:MAG: hypothetical protein ACXW20_07975, partial [Burkholderiales bacterium]
MNTLALCCALIAQAAFAGFAPGDYEISLTHQQLRRTYFVHVPPQAAQGRPLPAVINFHGGG